MPASWTSDTPLVLPPGDLGDNLAEGQTYEGSGEGTVQVTVQPGQPYLLELGNATKLTLKVSSGASETTAARAVIVPVEAIAYLTGTGGTACTASLRPIGLKWTERAPDVHDVGGAGQVATPAFSPTSGSFTTSVEVSLACSTAGATIHYTTDGSTPTAQSTEYTAPFTLNVTTTVKAIAVKEGMTNSAVASKTYTEYFPVRWGRSSSLTLDGAEIIALESNQSKTSPAGNYTFGGPNFPEVYYYLAWPDSFPAQPRVTDGLSTGGLPMAGDLAGSEQGYDQTQNGWPYKLVTVGGAAYRLYRTLYTQAGAMTIAVNL